MVLGFLSKGVSGKKNVRFMNQNIKIQLISVLVVGIIIGLGVYPFIFPTYYDEGLGPAIGSGFFVSDDGCIVTNAHVVEYTESMGFVDVIINLPIEIPEDRGEDEIITDPTWYTYYKYGEIIKVGNPDGGGYSDADLALIKIYDDSPIFFLDDDGNEVETNLAFSPIPVTINTNIPEEFDGALSIGHPDALGYWIANGGWFEMMNHNTNELIFSIFTFPGNSGGPILNLDGELVGVVWGWGGDVIIDEEGEALDEWYFPYNNMHADEYYQTEGIITIDNLGEYIFEVGYADTFAETSETVVDFLEGTPCNIKTSTSTPMRFSDEEYDKEIEQLTKIFEESKYKVVIVEEM